MPTGVGYASSGIAIVDIAIAVEFAFTKLQSLPQIGNASGNPGEVRAEGFAAKIMLRAPSSISTQPLIFRIRFFAASLRILLRCTRTEMPRFMFQS